METAFFDLDEKTGALSEDDLAKLNKSIGDFASATPKHLALIELSHTIQHLFRIARSREPVDWDEALERLDDETINYQDAGNVATRDALFLVELEMETILRITYSVGLAFGEIEGARSRAKSVATAGGVARSKKLKKFEDDVRAKIQRYIARHGSADEAEISRGVAKRKRRLSGTSIASAMIHGEESKLGIRKIADIASQELATSRSKA